LTKRAIKAVFNSVSVRTRLYRRLQRIGRSPGGGGEIDEGAGWDVGEEKGLGGKRIGRSETRP